MKNFFLAMLCFFTLTLSAQLQSPQQFLPGYGTQVSFYSELESYFAHMVQNSQYIKHMPYGKTTQGRGLNAYYISAPQNLANLETIRQTNLYNVGMGPKPAVVNEKAIVWLSFNVHGNEPAAAESAMSVAYELINPDNTETKKWLENTVVILDPCLNPDGYSRYGNWLRDISGKNPHPGLYDREHMEPWPGGRQNHYAYDLNRDWAWQTQTETQQRMALYNQWMPMVHADTHEMGYNDPYFFPPAAEPFHDFITKAQRDFHNAIGEATSKKFDRQGWGYYTRERFDLFYPSYGDTYPCFNGAVGMTYEQGGIGAGRAVELKNGTILTLQDRIDHHKTALLTTVETASWQKDKLVANFKAYFKDSREKPMGKYKTYIVKHSGNTSLLAKLLDLNKIQYTYASESKKLLGYHYQSNSEKSFTLEPNDLIISVNQPKAVLTQVLFEPEQHLTDSLSYDITAWALPHAYGAESYALKNYISVKTSQRVNSKEKLQYDSVYGYHIPWDSRESAKMLAQLHKNGIKVRSAKKSATLGSSKLNSGDLIILKNDNKWLPDFETAMQAMLFEYFNYDEIESGYSLNGSDLGGEFYTLLEAPKVLLLSGNGVSATEFGQVWFYMDQMMDYPVSIVDTDKLGRVNLNEYNTIILADGYYDINEPSRKKIDDFITVGGKVIAIQGALSLFENRQGYSLTQFATDDEKETSTKQADAEALKARYLNYQNAERQAVAASVTGAVIENKIDKTHPLSFGLGETYYSLKTGNGNYRPLKNAWNVAYVPNNYRSHGFIGSSLKKSMAGSVTFAVEEKGMGKIIYMIDNPLFRGFWENGNLLFSNALFLVD